MQYRIPVLKRAVPSLRKRFARLSWPNGFALKRSRDAVFLVNYRNFVDRQVAFYDDFEAAQIAHFLGHMAMARPDRFLDIGANFGYYAVLAARRGLAGRITAFEPDPRNAAQFEANLLLNGLVGRVELIRKAVSAATGPVDFLASSDSSTGQSKIGQGSGAQSIDAVALDDIVETDGEMIFLKIDIEGHELAAVRGMARMLTRNRVFIQVECFDPNLSALQDLLADAGLTHRHRIGDDHYFANF